MQRVTLLLPLLVMAAGSSAVPAAAQPLVLPVDQTIAPVPHGNHHTFGDRIAGDRHLMVVSGPDELLFYRWSAGDGWQLVTGSGSGRSALSMRGERIGSKSTANQNSTVLNFDGIAISGSGFGSFIPGVEAIAVAADRVAIGSPSPGPNLPGKVDVWGHVGGGNWQLEQSLTSVDPSERFGAAVDFTDASGTILWVGAPGDGTGGTGRVERWIRSGSSWISFGEIKDPEEQADNQFGAALAADGNRLIVGAPEQDQIVPFFLQDAGAAFIYTSGSLGAMTRDATFFGSDSDDRLGTAVDILDATAIAGAPRTVFFLPAEAAGVIDDAGVAQVYWRTGEQTWEHVALLRSDAPQSNDELGTAVALVGRTAVVGVPGLDDGQGNSTRGGALTFRGTNAIFVDSFESGDTEHWSSATP